MSNTVHVNGINQQTTEKEVRDFFSFWYVCLHYSLHFPAMLTFT